MSNMSITSAAPSAFIKGDKDIPAHLIQKPVAKCPVPGMPGHPGKPFPIDIDVIKQLPGKPINVIRLHDCNDIIDDTISAAKRFHGMTETSALRGFHADIKGMDQNELDEMKDTLVKRMASPDASQNERELMQKMYEITDAVSEHRNPPHLHDFNEVRPLPMPYPGPDFPRPIGPCKPVHPWLEQIKPTVKWLG